MSVWEGEREGGREYVCKRERERYPPLRQRGAGLLRLGLCVRVRERERERVSE